MRLREINEDVLKIKEFIDNEMKSATNEYRAARRPEDFIYADGKFNAFMTLNAFIHKNKMLNIFEETR